MPRKPTPKPDDPEQVKRFAAMAKEIEADEKPDALERALKKLNLQKKPAESHQE